MLLQCTIAAILLTLVVGTKKLSIPRLIKIRGGEDVQESQVDVKKSLLVSVSSSSSAWAVSAITGLLGSDAPDFLQIAKGDTKYIIHEFEKEYPTVAVAFCKSTQVENHADMAIITLDANLLQNTNTAIQRFSSALQSIKFSNDDSTKKVPFLIIYAGRKKDTEQIQKLLAQAWADTFPLSNIAPFDTLQVQLIFMPAKLSNGGFTEVALSVLPKLTQSIANTSRPLGDVISYFNSHNSTEVLRSLEISNNTRQSMMGVEAIRTCNDKVLTTSLKLIGGSKLLAKRETFVTAVDEIINTTVSLQEQYFNDYDTISDVVKALAKKDLLDDLSKYFDRIYLEHKRQILQQAIENFNNEFAELDITIDIAKDMRVLRNQVLKDFERSASKLISKKLPAGSLDYKSQWIILKNTLDEYIENQIGRYKLMGVLSRGRKPIDIAFHVLLNHPLGRDYRQDPLGMYEHTDSVIYDHRINPTEEVPVAKKARSNLKAREIEYKTKTNKNIKDRLEEYTIRSRSEFAREMQMLPLSIKNADTLIDEDKAKNKKKPKKDKKENTDVNRPLSKPEDYIRWDIEPLNEAKKNINELQRKLPSLLSVPRSGKDVAMKMKLIHDQLVSNFDEDLQQTNYIHPSYNHDSDKKR